MQQWVYDLIDAAVDLADATLCDNAPNQSRQLAEKVVKLGTRELKCRRCGKVIRYKLTDIRSHRRYCSTYCRARTYLNRQTEARQMAYQGMPIEQIAEELHSKVATIRGWVYGIKENT